MARRALVLALLSCACDRVLAIEEAAVDPELTPTADPCGAYCDAVLGNCWGSDAVYASRELCLGVCATLSPGDSQATSGNNLMCRLHAAELAIAEPAYYCPIAGPGGNGVCGDNCEGLCGLVSRVCGAFADTTGCLEQCAQLDDLGTFSADPSRGQGRGPHVQCRLYHAVVAVLEPDRHCSHALGAAPCD
jgi:hypothetical protein